MTLPTRSASYEDGIDWIAGNDEPDETDIGTVAEQISVVLLAELFGLDPDDVAQRVIARRRS